jgi:phage FluMu protein Com
MMQRKEVRCPDCGHLLFKVDEEHIEHRHKCRGEGNTKVLKEYSFKDKRVVEPRRRV